MLFAIIGHDGPDAKTLRPKLRPAHLDHLGPLSKAGRVPIAGPLTDGAGSLIVLEAGSIEDARAICDRDPYWTGGVFEKVDIHPFMKVFPEPGE